MNDSPVHERPLLVASWNGAPATARAAARYASGVPLLDAIVEGISLIEDDPAEMSVGLGGLPNEEGEVELDAAVMDGPRHKVGAVAALRRVRHAAAVALQVLRRTDHALLAGEGALRFARQVGFREEDLLTEEARKAWLHWKAQLSTEDAWLGSQEQQSEFGRARWAGHHENPVPGRPPKTPPVVPFTYGTVHVSGMDSQGNLFACTSTSGLSYKIPGRVGDSPIAGAGLYVDNDVGAAGATGRGEATLQTSCAFDVVRCLEQGMLPTDACLAALQRVVRCTREARLKNEKGQPTFNVTLYALRKDGLLGAASLHPGYEFVVQAGGQTLTQSCAALSTM